MGLFNKWAWHQKGGNLSKEPFGIKKNRITSAGNFWGYWFQCEKSDKDTLGGLVNLVVFLLTRLIMMMFFILIRWLCYAATIQVTLHCRQHFLIWPASRVSSLSSRDFGLWRNWPLAHVPRSLSFQINFGRSTFLVQMYGFQWSSQRGGLKTGWSTPLLSLSSPLLLHLVCPWVGKDRNEIQDSFSLSVRFFSLFGP